MSQDQTKQEYMKQLFIQCQLNQIMTTQKLSKEELSTIIGEIILTKEETEQLINFYKDIPQELKCPYSQKLMKNPHFDEFGHTYDLESLNYLYESNENSPKTEKPYEAKTKNKNPDVLEKIENFQKQKLEDSFLFVKNLILQEYKEEAFEIVKEMFALNKQLEQNRQDLINSLNSLYTSEENQYEQASIDLQIIIGSVIQAQEKDIKETRQIFDKLQKKDENNEIIKQKVIEISSIERIQDYCTELQKQLQEEQSQEIKNLQETIQEQKRDYENQIAEFKLENNEKLQEIKESYDNQMAEQKAKNDENIQEMRELIIQQRKLYEQELAEQKDHIQQLIQELKSPIEEQVCQQNDVLKTQFEDLEKNLQTELKVVKEELDNQANRTELIPRIPQGVQVNMSIGGLKSVKLTPLYEEPYTHITRMQDLDKCVEQLEKDSWVLVGAYHCENKDLLLTSAFGRGEIVLKKNYQNNSNFKAEVFEQGVYWYKVKGKAFGFADTQEINLCSGDSTCLNSQARLSWLLTNEEGGWRVGNYKGSSKDYFKVIYKVEFL